MVWLRLYGQTGWVRDRRRAWYVLPSLLRKAGRVAQMESEGWDPVLMGMEQRWL
jgi:hypothetical protein